MLEQKSLPPSLIASPDWLKGQSEFILKIFSPADTAGAKELVDKEGEHKSDPYLAHLTLKGFGSTTPTPWEEYSHAFASQFVFNFPPEVYENNFLEHFELGLDSPFLICEPSGHIKSLSIQLKRKNLNLPNASTIYNLLDRTSLPDYLRAYDGVNLEFVIKKIEPHMLDYTIKDMIKLMMSLGYDYAPCTPSHECLMHHHLKSYIEKQKLTSLMPPMNPTQFKIKI